MVLPKKNNNAIDAIAETETGDGLSAVSENIREGYEYN
ncbi:UNVERIFIED_CONTAM: hypothetical protein C7383_101613 [Murimonas intestini]|uniref:Uncharacterized protein n=1 Tax=Murimonas intestini TaxID=1337051 RepID=A0AB73TAC0_9FIRM